MKENKYLIVICKVIVIKKKMKEDFIYFLISMVSECIKWAKMNKLYEIIQNLSKPVLENVLFSPGPEQQILLIKIVILRQKYI